MKVSIIDQDKYIRIIEKNQKSITIYHTQEWLNVLKESYRINVLYIEILNQDNEILSVCPFVILKKFGFTFIGSSLRGTHTEYMGPVYLKKLDFIEKDKIIETYAKFLIDRYKPSYLQFSFPYNVNLNELSSLQHLKFVKEIKSSLLVASFDDEDVLWKSFKGRARTSVRKALKSNIVVVDSTYDNESLKIHYRMVKDNFERQGLTLSHPFILYENLLNTFAVKDNIKLFEARINNEIVASSIFLIYKNRMLFLSGGSNFKGNKYSANSLVQYTAMTYAIKNKITKYDLGGVGCTSIDKFKESFGGQKIDRVIYTKKTIIANFLQKVYLYFHSNNPLKFK